MPNIVILEDLDKEVPISLTYLIPLQDETFRTSRHHKMKKFFKEHYGKILDYLHVLSLMHDVQLSSINRGSYFMLPTNLRLQKTNLVGSVINQFLELFLYNQVDYLIFKKPK